ncbi:MAG: hypothetical protein F6K39_41530 [Okeania sp. SIO3B3]|nr:hypothetical protein [Okeania sp. SIO3B3]
MNNTHIVAIRLSLGQMLYQERQRVGGRRQKGIVPLALSISAFVHFCQSAVSDFFTLISSAGW